MTSASNITKLMLTFVTLTKVSLFLYNVHRDGKGSKCNGAFKSCQKDRIYELNAHEGHHYVV